MSQPYKEIMHYLLNDKKDAGTPFLDAHVQLPPARGKLLIGDRFAVRMDQCTSLRRSSSYIEHESERY